VSKLPDAERAYVALEKVENYLLSTSHPVGSGKAAFFRSFGFDAGTPEVFRDALIAHANSHEAAKVSATVHGTKYEVSGALATPSGNMPNVKTVWIVVGTAAPRLVTALPEKAKKP
jgi:hypothetical protein